jgi:hypothetical protein
MGEIVAAMLSSHAYAFVDPGEWDARRATRTRRNYAAKYGTAPPERPEVERETLDDNRRRYAPLRAGFDELRTRLAEIGADTVVLIGNDQDENFTPQAYPQFAVYAGEDFVVKSRTSGSGATGLAPVRYRSSPAVAYTILETALEFGYDPAMIARFGDDALESHAHREPLQHFDPDARQRVVPVFVNAIHNPAPAPQRCYGFGRMLRAALERSPDAGRVVLFASGGLSHFPADYPWHDYGGPLTIGAISEAFDRAVVDAIRAGNGSALAALDSGALLAHGEGELRQIIVMLGALGDVKPAFLRYEPFYRAIMGLAVGYWDLRAVTAGR